MNLSATSAEEQWLHQIRWEEEQSGASRLSYAVGLVSRSVLMRFAGTPRDCNN